MAADGGILLLEIRSLSWNQFDSLLFVIDGDIAEKNKRVSFALVTYTSRCGVHCHQLKPSLRVRQLFRVHHCLPQLIEATPRPVSLRQPSLRPSHELSNVRGKTLKRRNSTYKTRIREILTPMITAERPGQKGTAVRECLSPGKCPQTV